MRQQIGLIISAFAILVSVVIWIEVRFSDVRESVASFEAEVIEAIDRHEEFVSTEHRDNLSDLREGQAESSQTLTNAVYQVGVHQGQHQTCGG